MKNKKILTFNLMIFCAICLFLPSMVIAQSSSYIKTDATIENTTAQSRFTTVTTSEGDLRVSTPYRSNISPEDHDDYDGNTIQYTPPTTPRYIPVENKFYNVFGDIGNTQKSLMCRSVRNQSAHPIYLTGTKRTIRHNNTTEWKSFIDIIGQNTQPGIDIKKCFCTDTESRYRLQDGAYCGNDYCLNENCVLDTQTDYPVPFDTTNSACLPDTGYHMIACTNELCKYEDLTTSSKSQIVPGRSALYKPGSDTLGSAGEISLNRKKGFCEICANFDLPLTGKNPETSSFNRSFFGGNTHVPTAIWNAYVQSLLSLEQAQNNLEEIDKQIQKNVDQPLSKEIANYETILSLQTDIPKLNTKKTFFDTSLRNDYPDLESVIETGIQYIIRKIQYIIAWDQASEEALLHQNEMSQYNGRTDLTLDEIALIGLYKISAIQNTSKPNILKNKKILQYNKKYQTITYKKTSSKVTVTICFRYTPSQSYNSNRDHTKP